MFAKAPAFAVILLFSLFAQATVSPALQRLFDRTVNHDIKFYPSVEKQSSRGCPKGRTFVVSKDPWNSSVNQITLNEYGSPGSTRAVIIMPPTGGENVLDQQWANLFCSKGIRTVIVNTFELFPENGVDLNSYDIEALRSLAAIRDTAEYLQNTGTKSIGLLGTSLGALQGSLAVMVDDRINTAALIVGGMGLAQIASHSTEPTQAELRQMRETMWKLNDAEYAEKLRTAVHIDTFPFEDDKTLATRKKVFSVIATKDSYVPTANQYRLYNVWGGNQPLIRMARDHVDTVMRTSLMHAMEIYNFFDENLAR